jgi:ABC-type Zn uptake system ZnuABC Zn-binding protein ZnuA
VEIYLNGFHSRVAAEAIRDAVATVNAGNKATREANAIAIADRLRAIAKSLNAMADGIIAKT